MRRSLKASAWTHSIWFALSNLEDGKTPSPEALPRENELGQYWEGTDCTKARRIWHVKEYARARLLWPKSSNYSQELEVGEAPEDPRGDRGDLVSVENPGSTPKAIRDELFPYILSYILTTDSQKIIPSAIHLKYYLQGVEVAEAVEGVLGHFGDLVVAEVAAERHALLITEISQARKSHCCV